MDGVIFRVIRFGVDAVIDRDDRIRRIVLVLQKQFLYIGQLIITVLLVDNYTVIVFQIGFMPGVGRWKRHETDNGRWSNRPDMFQKLAAFDARLLHPTGKIIH